MQAIYFSKTRRFIALHKLRQKFLLTCMANIQLPRICGVPPTHIVGFIISEKFWISKMKNHLTSNTAQLNRRLQTFFLKQALSPKTIMALPATKRYIFKKLLLDLATLPLDNFPSHDRFNDLKK